MALIMMCGQPCSGKSTVAASLAAALEQRGVSAILVDHRVFPLPIAQAFTGELPHHCQTARGGPKDVGKNPSERMPNRRMSKSPGALLHRACSRKDPGVRQVKTSDIVTVKTIFVQRSSAFQEGFISVHMVG